MAETYLQQAKQLCFPLIWLPFMKNGLRILMLISVQMEDSLSVHLIMASLVLFTFKLHVLTTKDNGFGDGSGPVDWQSVQPNLALQLYQYYGNKKIIEEAYPYSQTFIELLLANPETVESGLGDWMSLGFEIVFPSLIRKKQAQHN